jgi:hypothetical protein
LDNYKEYIDKKDAMPTGIYSITDFTTCGLWWQKYNGNKKIIRCVECDTLTVRGSNRQKYCKECARKKELDGKNLYNQMYYQRHKVG